MNQANQANEFFATLEEEGKMPMMMHQQLGLITVDVKNSENAGEYSKKSISERIGLIWIRERSE